MARIVGPLMSQTARGLVGSRLVFSVRKTGQQVRFQRSNIDKNSIAQQTNREVYKDAVAEWNLLTAGEKEVWIEQAVGQNLTGFNLFIQNYYMNTVRVISTIHNVDLKVAAKTLLYTVPAGFDLVTLGFVVRPVITTNLVLDGGCSLQRVSDNEGCVNFSNILINGVDVSTFYGGDLAIGPLNQIVHGADGLDFSVDTPDTSDVLIVDIDLIGYLVEA